MPNNFIFGQNMFFPMGGFQPNPNAAGNQMPKSQEVALQDLGSAIRASSFLSAELGSAKAKWGGVSEWYRLHGLIPFLEEAYTRRGRRGVEEYSISPSLFKPNCERSHPRCSSQPSCPQQKVRHAVPNQVLIQNRDLDTRAVDITSHLMSMAGGIKTLQAEGKGKAGSLLDGAKAVSDSLTDMLALMGQVCVFFFCLVMHMYPSHLGDSWILFCVTFSRAV